MSSPFRSVGPIIASCIGMAMRLPGGKALSLTRCRLRGGYGTGSCRADSLTAMETNNLSLRLETLPVTHDVVSTNRSQSPKRAAKHRSYRLSCTMVLQTADQFIDAFLGGSTRFRNGLHNWCPLAASTAVSSTPVSANRWWISFLVSPSTKFRDVSQSPQYPKL
jgi:hypothetical protein